MSLEKQLKLHLKNIPGFTTQHKIVVFESDDWGSIRTRSKEDFTYFKDKGYNVAGCTYNRLDALESNTDISELLNVLSKYEDVRKKPAIFTFNHIVANPDFNKIKEHEFSSYFYEPFTTTLESYPGSDQVVRLYVKGMQEKLINVQFHGREHLHIGKWMKALNDNNKPYIEAFKRNMFTVQYGTDLRGRSNFLDAFGSASTEDIEEFDDILRSGIDLFKNLWNYLPSSFIAPTYTWHPDIENQLSHLGIKYIQGTHVQRVPNSTKPTGITRKYHYMGQRNKHGQRYLIRNAFFEPSSNTNLDWVGLCMKEISTAFKWKKPAVISTHRLNYIGRLSPENRERNLKLLNQLLSNIVSEFPNVIFMSSDELGRLIENKNLCVE